MQALLPRLRVGQKAPLGKFHVDAQKNTSSATNALLKDDLVITEEGKMGLGTSTPSTRVDLLNTENKDTALGLGKTSQTAAEADAGAIRYDANNGIEYSNETDWIKIAGESTQKTIVATTKDTWGSSAANAFCYNGGFNSTQSTLPNRAPCYIRLWTSKYSNTTAGGTLNAETGQFTANRDGIFTATFTFALQAAPLAASTDNANQVEAIWRHIRDNTEINSVKWANTYSSNSNGNILLGSCCTANFDMQKNDIIRPEIWMDVSNGANSNQTANQRRQFDVSNNGSYNNLTIIEN